MSIKLKGSSDGSVSFDAPADTSPSGSDITLTLPTSAGSANQFLKNSGIAGELEYSSMVETSTGVGIGTSSPARNLHVHGSDSDTVQVHLTNSTTGATSNDGFSVVLGSDESAILNMRENNPMRFFTNDSERMRVDTSGRLLVGTVSSVNAGSMASAMLQVEHSSGSVTGAFYCTADTAQGGTLVLGHGRGSATGVLQSGDTLGDIRFAGADGTDLQTQGARISGEVDGTPGSNDMPGRLVFSTTADGASSPTERARISRDGYFKASNDGSYASTVSYHEFRQSNNEQMLLTRASHTSFTENMLILRARRFQTSAYTFLRCQSNDGSDTEFVLRGDGNAYADNSWNGGGADYAEYFEWSDGNSAAEDRRGISVVLDGDKIREAVTGEEPIGVISGNPSVVGDADIDRWKGKYLRDDYGTYIQEDYEVEDDDGNTVVQQRRKLNPDYDPDTEYVTRENRPEWDTVGLMGKLRIRKGQVTGTRWIKMRDVSDTVEEWLVR